MTGKRSIGVTLFGVSAIVLGLLTLLSEVMELIDVQDADYIGNSFYVVFLTQILYAFTLILSGIFILKLRNWARILFLLFMGLRLFQGMAGLYSNRHSFLAVMLPLFLVFNLLLFIISLYFFTRPKVKTQFK